MVALLKMFDVRLAFGVVRRIRLGGQDHFEPKNVVVFDTDGVEYVTDVGGSVLDLGELVQSQDCCITALYQLLVGLDKLIIYLLIFARYSGNNFWKKMASHYTSLHVASVKLTGKLRLSRLNLESPR